MIHPLKLRLHILPVPDLSMNYKLVIQRPDFKYGFATLEFENPLNGTWHEVAWQDDAQIPRGTCV